MNRKYQSFIASLVLLVLFGVMTGCRETPINNNPVPRGTQFVGEINGVVRDGNTGAPLSGVTLRLIGPDGDLSTTTNADGIYVFRNLQAGTYKIAAAAPAGYAATRTQDGIELRQEPNQSTGVAVVRVARDFRFFTANAAFAATLQYQTPDGRLLPVPAGTPVFINFVKNTEPGREVTVGDVQVALVRDSVRAGGAVSITGLPAVGALSQAGPNEVPRFIVPVFTVGGVTYGDPTTAKALNYAIAGLRPGTTFTLPPTVGIIRSSGGTASLSLLATNMNSRTNFGTTDTIFVAFNKSINTFRFDLVRTQTPYPGLPTGPIASTDDGSLTATLLPTGAVPQLGGIIVGANQAFAIRLNRPFIAGSEHRLNVNAIADDGDVLNAATPSFTRTFTTVPGIRLLSVTAAGVTLATTPESALNVDSIIFRFELPPGRQLVGPYFTRGPRRNVRFASGSTVPGGGTDEVGRAGVSGEANRIDCVGVINGANLSFGYRTLVGTTYQIHTMLVNAVAEQPIVSDVNVAIGTVGNFRSNLPGDFGVGAVGSPDAGLNSFRTFTAAVNQAIVPRIVSVALPANPGDSIRITFSRPMRRSTAATAGLAVGDTFRTEGSVIRFFRTATAQPYGPAANFPTGVANPIPIRISSISSSGDTTTYFLVRDQQRVLDGAPIPFEGNTSYTLQILGSMAAVSAAGGRRLDELAGATFPRAETRRTAGQRLESVTVSGVGVFPTPAQPLPIPDSGTIVLRFARPIRQDIDYRTRGVGQNFELVRTTAVSGQILPPPTAVDLGPDNTTIFIDPVGVKGDCTITFNYRGLYRNATYAIRAVGSPLPSNFFDPPNAQDVPDSIRNVRWAAFPNDPGVGVGANYNSVIGNRLDVEFTVTATPPRLIAASTDTNSAAYPLVSSANPLLANSIRLYFDREMDRGGNFTLTRVASPYGLVGTIQLRPTWSADGKSVRLVPQAGMRSLTDTSRTLEAGTTYRLNISDLNDVNGNPFSPPVNPIIFNTQPGIRLVGVTVGGQTFTAPGQPIKADSVGTIKLIFNQNIAGSYNVRGPLGNSGFGRFIMVEDSLALDLARVNAKLPLTNGVVGANIDSSRAAFVDSLATVNNNEITINYVISAQRLVGRTLAGDIVGFPNPPASYGPRTIRFSIDSVSFAASPNGGTTASDSLYYNIQQTPRPRTIRGPVRGDLGVSGFLVGLLTTSDNKYINNRTPFNRFGPGNTGLTRFAFYFSTEGVPAAQSFPDLVISSVRNAAESVSQAAKQAVSTVRGWWKRFRGE